MILIKFFLTWVLYDCFKLIYAYLMKGIKFSNVIAVWKWWYKPIYILVFSQDLSLNVNHLNDSMYIWNCCNQAQLLNKKCLVGDIFVNSQFKKYNCNSTHSYNRKIWVDIPSCIIFPWLIEMLKKLTYIWMYLIE